MLFILQKGIIEPSKRILPIFLIHVTHKKFLLILQSFQQVWAGEVCVWMSEKG
jgi:hypothetical protein